MTETLGKYPNTFYRVSLKAIIRDEQGRVLLVKENGSTWNFPGGGMDHGETAEDALKRELQEEAALDAPFEATLLGVDSYYLETKEAWLMWIVYEVVPAAGFTYGKGTDADDVAFIDPQTFKDDDERHAHQIYKWAVEKSPR